MPPITASLEVERPPEEVFAYVTGPAHMPEWRHGCVSDNSARGSALAAHGTVTPESATEPAVGSSSFD
jgi:uncharacterized protein YndB with AHSA1/START domain